MNTKLLFSFFFCMAYFSIASAGVCKAGYFKFGRICGKIFPATKSYQKAVATCAKAKLWLNDILYYNDCELTQVQKILTKQLPNNTYFWVSNFAAPLFIQCFYKTFVFKELWYNDDIQRNSSLKDIVYV